MPELATIYDYMRKYSTLLGERILAKYPALHRFEDAPSPRIDRLLRRSFAAQTIAIMGTVARWRFARTALIIAECGTGKTLISLGAAHVHSGGKPYTALAMVPPHLVNKWAREAFQTIPGVRVFMIDDLRNGGADNTPHGVNEVRLRQGKIVREGLATTLTEMRLRRGFESSRKRWDAICSRPALFIVGREKAKLGYFWRHAYLEARSGFSRGCITNAETGEPIIMDEERLLASDFANHKRSQTIDTLSSHACRTRHSALWQADTSKIPRMAPVEFIGRYMTGWFDYAICDEIHQLAGDTAQGNALGTLASCATRLVGLTGTMHGGYADDLFNTLFRLEARKMKEAGYEWGTAGRGRFTQDFGVLETITKMEPEDNSCSKAKTTSVVRRKPGASPLLFGELLMQLCAFVFLEDISTELPPYEERLVSVGMDERLRQAYQDLEDQIREALKENKGNHSVLSTMLNSLLLYPDHPFGIGTLYGKKFDEDLGRRVKFVIAEPADLPQDFLYAKERRLIEEVKKELAEGRRCQIFAVYTRKHDVLARLEKILQDAGIRTAVLRANVPTSKREAWYATQVKQGVQVNICHPKLVETGLDLLDFPTIIFYETGYSLHTLRQASRRSWRIGQKWPVRVLFMCYEGTMQTSCLRLMGKKLLVALTTEGKFAGEGLQSIDEDDDLLSAMARELVEKSGIGESADAIWKALHDEHQKSFPAQSHADSQSSGVVEFLPPEFETSAADSLIEAAVSATDVLVFGQSSESLRPKRRRSRVTTDEQPSLFAWN